MKYRYQEIEVHDSLSDLTPEHVKQELAEFKDYVEQLPFKDFIKVYNEAFDDIYRRSGKIRIVKNELHRRQEKKKV